MFPKHVELYDIKPRVLYEAVLRVTVQRVAVIRTDGVGFADCCRDYVAQVTYSIACMTLMGERLKCWYRNSRNCHFVHHKFHTVWRGIQPGPPRREAGD
jgi:hypothetical protein